MYPQQFTSSLFRLFDWIMGTSSTLKGKRVAMTGTGGAFGAALRKQLESDGVSEVTALRYGVDFDDATVSTNSIQALANTDILILAHGLRHGDVMEANYETSRRLVGVFAQTREPRTGPRPNELPEVWYTGSEAEMHPSWGDKSLAAYSASKRRFLPFAKSLYENGGKYVPVTYTGIAYVHFFKFLFGIKAEANGLRFETGRETGGKHGRDGQSE
jgi:hypothetical protein